MPTTDNILNARAAVDLYRQEHAALHQKPYYRKVHEDHTPLLAELMQSLESLGYTSTEIGFERKKTEILAKFWADSDLLNIQIFKECYTIEGTCCHECYGIKRGCLESWYQKRMKETENETLEPLVSGDQVRNAYLANPPPKHLPPACTYRIVRIKEPEVNWQWS